MLIYAFFPFPKLRISSFEVAKRHNKLMSVNTGVTENTSKASYIIQCCRSSLWVTSGDSIMGCVSRLSSQRFRTSTKNKWKDLHKERQGDIFKRLTPFLFCCLVLDCKVTVILNLVLYIYRNLVYYTFNILN